MTNQGKKTLEICIEYSDCPHGAIDHILTDAIAKVKTLLEQAASDGLVELHGFDYSILGDDDEEQAVNSADIWEITNGDLDDLMFAAVAGHDSAFVVNNNSIEDQIRFLCRQLGGVAVIKRLKAITEKRR